ncbi:MAG: PqqD family protein [Candidatus Eisenbacteria bacterium]|uniref:PqqD family protein n=1 Tax=Eiseniibacteriota bacterium TaxID=2212470 RepID=A0A538TAE6_UNCEI|nr:MAG: PqqD family protein [Candidatus Eisenbacteria bacterium]
MPSSSERWKIAPEVAHESFGDAAVVLNLRSGVYYTLNEVAARAWEKLGKPVDLPGLTDALSTMFQVERSVLAEDLEALLTELERLQLVVRVCS